MQYFFKKPYNFTTNTLKANLRAHPSSLSAIPNVKRIVDGSPDTRRHFESRSMERKYSEAICELTASTWPAGKLIRLSEH